MKSIGIDIGTTAICIVCYNYEEDKIIDMVNIENKFISNTYWQDADIIVDEIEKVLTELVPNQKDIKAIGISTQMHGILYVNQFGKALSPFYTWKENSGNEIYKENKTYAQYLSEKTGYKMYTGYGSVTHFYMGITNNIPNEAVKMVNIGDYVAMQLCGLTKSKIDITIAASFGGVDLQNKNFDKKALKNAGVDVKYYPSIDSAGNVAGYYKSIPVFYAWGDNQISFYSTAMDIEDAININVGTGSQISIYSNEYVENNNIEIRPFLKNGYIYVGASINGGKVYERLAKYFKEIISSFTNEEVDIYEWMHYMGNKKEKTDLIINPFLYGIRGDKKIRGKIKNLSDENFYVSDFIRAYVKGMAQELFELYEEFPTELKKKKKKIIVSGNGIRKNILLKDEIKKIFELPVVEKKMNEEAACGAAAYAISLYKKIRV